MKLSRDCEKNWSKWHERLHKALKQKSNLLPTGSSLLLSISGGQDSMALLKLIMDLQRIYKWEIHIWHGDHGWHDQSQKISVELEQWCRTKKLPFACNKTNKNDISTESKAREWRYQNLIKQARMISKHSHSTSCKYILTGHTGSDRAETFIMNLARGANIRGLSSLKECRELEGDIQLIRPMLNFSREETKQICLEMSLPIWIDPSNSDLNFTRNRIRKGILPILESLHSGSTMRIAKLADKFGYLHSDQCQLTKLAIEGVKEGEGLNRTKITQLSLSARAILFSYWLEENSVPLFSSVKLQELSQKVSKKNPPGTIDISDQLQVKWDKNSILLLRKSSMKRNKVNQQQKIDA